MCAYVRLAHVRLSASECDVCKTVRAHDLPHCPGICFHNQRSSCDESTKRMRPEQIVAAMNSYSTPSSIPITTEHASGWLVTIAPFEMPMQ